MKKSILKKYAELIIKKGVNLQKGQELTINASIESAPLVEMIVKEAYLNKALKVRVDWTDSNITRLDYKYQSVKTLSTYDKWVLERLQHRVDTLPARLYIMSDDPDALKGVNLYKIGKARSISYPIIKPYLEKIENKEQWCIVGASAPKWAKKVFPTLSKKEATEKLWEAIMSTSRMCDDPIKEWEKHNQILKEKCAHLNSLNLKELHYTSANGTDLRVGLISDALFLGGSETTIGSNIEFNPNIPSEECFTSPMKGKAEGVVYSTKPLSYQGQLIENFHFRFEDGKVVEVHAEKNEDLLKQMIEMDENACYLGEVALIPFDSPINNTGILFFNTLYDENASCHLALGMGFTNCIKDYHKYTKEELAGKGINDSMIHVDFMIGNKDMNIMGKTAEGEEVPIFKNGNWAF